MLPEEITNLVASGQQKLAEKEAEEARKLNEAYRKVKEAWAAHFAEVCKRLPEPVRKYMQPSYADRTQYQAPLMPFEKMAYEDVLIEIPGFAVIWARISPEGKIQCKAGSNPSSGDYGDGPQTYWDFRHQDEFTDLDMALALAAKRGAEWQKRLEAERQPITDDQGAEKADRLIFDGEADSDLNRFAIKVNNRLVMGWSMVGAPIYADECYIAFLVRDQFRSWERDE